MERRLGEIYDRARDLFDEGKYEEAEYLFHQILRDHPSGFADVHNKLGQIAHAKGALEQAASHFEKALDINPKYTEASLNLSVTYNEQGRYEEANDIFNRAAKIVRQEPVHIDPFILGKLANEHAKLGDQYADIGLHDEALEQYRKAIHLRPMFVDIVTKIGITQREKGLPDEAIKTLTQAKEMKPEYIPARIHLGVTYYIKGFLDMAIEEWEQAQALDPEGKNARVYLSLARKEVL